MTEQEIIRILEESGALLTGHFQLRSGLHSNRFFQAALLLEEKWPLRMQRITADGALCRQEKPQKRSSATRPFAKIHHCSI